MDPRELPTATLPMVVPALCSTVVCGPHQTSLPQPWRGPRPFVPATRSVRRAPVPGKRLAPLPMFSVEAHRVQRRLRRRNKARGKGGGVLSPTSQHAFRARTPPEQGPQMRRRAPRPESSNAQLGIEEPPEYTRMVAQYLTGLAADIAAEQETTLAAYEAGEIDENGVWESEHARMELMSLLGGPPADVGMLLHSQAGASRAPAPLAEKLERTISVQPSHAYIGGDSAPPTPPPEVWMSTAVCAASIDMRHAVEDVPLYQTLDDPVKCAAVLSAEHTQPRKTFVEMLQPEPDELEVFEPADSETREACQRLSPRSPTPRRPRTRGSTASVQPARAATRLGVGVSSIVGAGVGVTTPGLCWTGPPKHRRRRRFWLDNDSASPSGTETPQRTHTGPISEAAATRCHRASGAAASME
eukprot:TRINITY_DN11596_c0_g1_i1.p1 TRINITY_DN11596_c0_g1~~TRINITY_DN11596_c0_g1_i1.p1  ORF type:complete len:439 (+),score=109.30 TRINITY_DN11596_c0_g1_i1:78-1319(+)